MIYNNRFLNISNSTLDLPSGDEFYRDIVDEAVADTCPYNISIKIEVHQEGI
jgi:hypothetical protein